MLHRLRSVLVRLVRGRLSGSDEVDETFIGGEEAGLREGRQRGKQVRTGIAVEVREPKGIGWCRMAVLADGSAESRHRFITGAVEPGARVITDGWNGSSAWTASGTPMNGAASGLPGPAGTTEGTAARCAPRRLASQAVAAGRPKGSVEEAHLPASLNEFAFRFHRCNSRRPRHARLPRDGTGRRARADPVADILASRKPRGKAPATRGSGSPPAWNAQQEPAWCTTEMSSRFHSGQPHSPDARYRNERRWAKREKR